MLSSKELPIAAAMLPLGDAHPVDGPESSAERWLSDLTEVSDEGFSEDAWRAARSRFRGHVVED